MFKNYRYKKFKNKVYEEILISIGVPIQHVQTVRHCSLLIYNRLKKLLINIKYRVKKSKVDS